MANHDKSTCVNITATTLLYTCTCQQNPCETALLSQALISTNPFENCKNHRHGNSLQFINLDPNVVGVKSTAAIGTKKLNCTNKQKRVLHWNCTYDHTSMTREFLFRTQAFTTKKWILFNTKKKQPSKIQSLKLYI